MATPDNPLNLLGNPITKGLSDKAKNGLFLNYFKYLNRFFFCEGILIELLFHVSRMILFSKKQNYFVLQKEGQ